MSVTPSRRAVLSAGLAAPLVPRRAAAFERPARLVVGVTPGSAPDLVARILAQALTHVRGAPVQVENRPGAGGALGVEAVLREPADGRTLLFGSSGPMAVLPAVRAGLAYHPLVQLRPLAHVAEFPLVAIAAREAGGATLEALVAKAVHGLDFAGGEIASTQHLAGLLLAHRSGMRLNHVPYRTALAQADLLAGRIPLLVDSLPVVQPLSHDPRAAWLATFGQARMPGAPAVPTFAECGIEDCEASGWMGVFAPAGVPAATRAGLAAEVLAALALPGTTARIDAAWAVPRPMDAAAFAAFVAAELERWSAVARLVGLRA